MTALTGAARVLAVFIALWTADARALTCTVAASPVSFGAYNPFDAAPLDSTGNVQVTCGYVLNILVSYTILLSTGSSGASAQRRLVNGANRLAYNLYTDSARSSIWGDGAGGSVNVSESYLLVLLSDQRNYSVYGRVRAGQNVPPGTYTDSITVTVNY